MQNELKRTPIQIAVDEYGCEQATGISVHWLRRDRSTKRLLPFYKVGGLVRYDLDRVREALSHMEEGGPESRRRRSAAR